MRDSEPLTCTIYFLDNSMKRYPITEDTTVKALLDTIARDLNYSQMDSCAIFDVKDFEYPIHVRENLVVYDVMNQWQQMLMSGFKGKMGIKKVSSHKLVLRKRLYLSEPAEKISCPIDLHLLFSQARQDVAFGRFSITEVEALLLASLTLQIEYGDYDAKKHQGGFLRDILQEYIPANIYRKHQRNRMHLLSSSRTRAALLSRGAFVLPVADGLARCLQGCTSRRFGSEIC